LVCCLLLSFTLLYRFAWLTKHRSRHGSASFAATL
jgi:hypothetical protein